jgi:hypothetical protein
MSLDCQNKLRRAVKVGVAFLKKSLRNPQEILKLRPTWGDTLRQIPHRRILCQLRPWAVPYAARVWCTDGDKGTPYGDLRGGSVVTSQKTLFLQED